MLRLSLTSTVEGLQADLTLSRLAETAAGSMLLSVQQDCIRVEKRAAALDADLTSANAQIATMVNHFDDLAEKHEQEVHWLREQVNKAPTAVDAGADLRKQFGAANLAALQASLEADDTDDSVPTELERRVAYALSESGVVNELPEGAMSLSELIEKNTEKTKDA